MCIRSSTAPSRCHRPDGAPVVRWRRPGTGAPVRWVTLLLCCAGVGCARLQTAAVLAQPGPLPRQAQVADVPFFPQEQYYCGPAALAMVLTWSGLPATPEETGSQVYTPGRKGTLRTDVLAAARRQGRLAVPVGDLQGLLAEIAAGHPVLVFQNLAFNWYPLWHFAVAVGYDLDAREIVLHTGLSERRAVRLSTFERTWARGEYWAVVVLPPDRLPASRDHRAILRAAAGLERAKRYAAAGAAYERILERWPQNFGAHIGLGNARYATGDLPRAEEALREATVQHPDRPAAWNNLAHVLAEQGRRAEALAAAEEAVRLDGGATPAYQATLEEIRGLQPDAASP